MTYDTFKISRLETRCRIAEDSRDLERRGRQSAEALMWWFLAIGVAVGVVLAHLWGMMP